MIRKIGWVGTTFLSLALLGSTQISPVAATRTDEAAIGLPAAVATPGPERATPRWNDVARLLAGLEPELANTQLRPTKRALWQRHRRELDAAWKSFAERRLDAMKRFAARELEGLPFRVGPVYYPFSGPDALHALALFPRVNDFVFTGLEPVGGSSDLADLASLEERVTPESLYRLRQSIGSVLEWSFFRTHEMKVDLVANQLEGVTPILLLFLARHEFTIHGVEAVALDSDAQLRELAGAGAVPRQGAIPGVRVRFSRPGETVERRIHYFTADLSDAGLAKTPQYLEFLKRTGFHTTLIKSASYLMHDEAFSRVRDLIVAESRMVVQDDSGVPLRHFAESDWARRLYGTYNGPIPLFNNRLQKDVRKAYQAEGAMPIDFVYGYNFKDRGNNLQRFVRRVTVASQ